MEALLKLNPITPEQAEQVIYKLRSAVMSGSYTSELVNSEFFKKLYLKPINR